MYCVADINENYYRDLGSKGLRNGVSFFVWMTENKWKPHVAKTCCSSEILIIIASVSS